MSIRNNYLQNNFNEEKEKKEVGEEETRSNTQHKHMLIFIVNLQERYMRAVLWSSEEKKYLKRGREKKTNGTDQLTNKY